ncbi:hypothetical protein FEM48_Zijuj12G0210100 [Ziziphus jujuba var. spinosa]|uniref:SAM-dependent MTase DRM-type domain-containing protein n=1 Tax=Ziziphus jujuba var. spinosa TaxID=714518 RepID=A0A978UFI7_ZIZJJ|nr:hypothetical protein FEM48_Zijuj12G0210100 [Ziziphus jujuba var. spinosa]
MGFRPSLVYKVIEEKGEDDVDLILETPFAYSAPQKSNSESSDSRDSLFDDNGISSPLEIATLIQPKEEPEIANEIDDGKRASLLMMNFSVNEVEFSIDKLSEDAPVDELVDFIVAAQIAERFEKDTDDTSRNDEEKNEVLIDSYSVVIQFMTFLDMWKLLVDYETGHWNSLMISAILAHLRFKNSNSLSGGQYIVEMSIMVYTIRKIEYRKYLLVALLKINSLSTVLPPCVPFFSSFLPYLATRISIMKPCLGQWTKLFVCWKWVSLRIRFHRQLKILVGSEAPILELADPIFKGRIPDKCRGKYKHHSTAANINHSQTRKGCNPDSMGGNPSYHSTAAHINHSQTRKGCKDDSMGMQDVLRNPSYDVKTENEDFSVDAPQSVDMNLEEAYLGKRPKEEYIDPTWEEEKIDPSLSTIGMANGNTSKNGNRMNRFYVVPKPPMTIEDAIPQTKKWWPPWDMTKQLSHINSETTGICQLCDRVGRMLAELRGQLSYEQIALHRLGIRLRDVVSVETSGMKRRILKRWWQNTGQSGELLQIEDIQRLTSSKLESLFGKFGGFELIICQNPCTGDSVAGLDSPSFYEFVRVLQRRLRIPSDSR